MRWLIGLVVVAAIGAAAFFLLHGRGNEAKPAPTREVAPDKIAVRPLKPPAPPTEISDKQEQDERRVVEEFARDQKLTVTETDKLLAALKLMQDGRRQLFADLKDRKILIEDLSARLRDLRTAMNKSFESDLAKPRSDQLIERMRIAHGGEEKSPQ